jgi:hypothetical protein
MRMMATAMTRRKGYKFGSLCARRSTCSDIHPEEQDDNDQLEDDGQKPVHCQCSASEISVSSDVCSKTVDSNDQQDSHLQSKEMPRERIGNFQVLNSRAGSLNRRTDASGSSSMLAQLKNEIEVLFCVSQISMIVLAVYLFIAAKCTHNNLTASISH